MKKRKFNNRQIKAWLESGIPDQISADIIGQLFTPEEPEQETPIDCDLEEEFCRIHEAQQESHASMQSKKDSLREAIGGNCTHPESLVREWEEDRDNGYGRVVKVTVQFCQLCQKMRDESYGSW